MTVSAPKLACLKQGISFNLDLITNQKSIVSILTNTRVDNLQ